jgi:hypothetical protein
MTKDYERVLNIKKQVENFKRQLHSYIADLIDADDLACIDDSMLRIEAVVNSCIADCEDDENVQNDNNENKSNKNDAESEASE